VDQGEGEKNETPFLANPSRISQDRACLACARTPPLKARSYRETLKFNKNIPKEGLWWYQAKAVTLTKP